MTVAVTNKLYGILVADSRVTDQTANNTRFIVGEAYTLGTVDAEGKTKRVGASVARARPGWHPSAQNTMHVSPMKAPPQLEFMQTPLCVRVSEQSICEPHEPAMWALLTNSPDDGRRADVANVLPLDS